MLVSLINMHCSAFMYFTLILVVLIPNYGSTGSELQTSTDSIDDKGDSGSALCRIARNARNSVLTKALESVPDPDFINSCVVSESCTSLLCSTKAKEQNEKFGWRLKICDSSGSKIDFIFKSPSITNSSWLYSASPQTAVQRPKVPLMTGESGLDYYLNITFLRWFSQLNPSDEKWSTLSLDVSLDTCNRTCESVKILTGIEFPLMQLCESVDSAVTSASLIRSNPKTIQIPKYFTSRKGMPCTMENPFVCGKNSVCRYHEGGAKNEGICDCCDTCELAQDGSCRIGSRTSTVPPSSATHESDDDGDSSSAISGFGAFFAIVFLILLGGGIFYGVKYNMFSRVHNRIRMCWASHCSHRVISVADQGHMFNPIYDDDDPPLL